MNTWIPVTTQLPESEKRVIAAYKNALGNWRIICAFYALEKTLIDDGAEVEDSVYDEENDCFYWPAGWYEVIDNWDNYSSISIYQGTVSHWMPLPEAPHD